MDHARPRERLRSPSRSATAATQAGNLGNGTGFNAYALRGSTAPWFGAATITKTGDDYDLVGTQDHWSIEGRNIVRSATLEDFKAKPAFAKEMEHGIKLDKRISLYADKEYRGDQWGMAIDMNACTGCMACVIACVAENNIPVVGKAQVGKNREMHWLRIDRYFAGNLDTPDTYFQPMPCQQCENAPCEVVCPVSATVHSDEGLNDMVYNRCVGTRYCSNNCPWKVRRFNFLLFQDWNTPQFKLQRNPDVTVRSRGIMEKCTYCVQRINAARIQAKREDRAIRDGEIVTACQAVCPTEAIVFGNINDPNSKVAKLKSSPRNYTMLEDLNTRPRTTYLAAVRNPNPDLSCITTRWSAATTRRPSDDHGGDTNGDRSHQDGAARRDAGDPAGSRFRDGHRDRRGNPAFEAVPARLDRHPARRPGRCRHAADGARLPGASRASASGATTSRSAGRSTSSTSSGGSASATPAR